MFDAPSPPPPSAWLTTAAELREALASTGTRVPGSAARPLVIDARGWLAYRLGGHVPGAVRVSWLSYRDGRFLVGRLPRDLAATARRLAALGVDSSRPVVVYGAASEGWGEEGRVAWMLHYLGHPDVRVHDGGWRAWREAGGMVTRRVVEQPPGRFPLALRQEVRASGDDVAAALAARARGEPAPAILDTRSGAEWKAYHAYAARRVGRIPGAVHLEWHHLLDPSGRVDRS